MDQGDIEMKSEVHEELLIKDEPIDQFYLTPSSKNTNMLYQDADISVFESVLSLTENTNFKNVSTCQTMKQETSEACAKSKMLNESEKLEESSTYYVKQGKRTLVANKIVMERIKENDLFCEKCFLKFDTKWVYDIHLSFVHQKGGSIMQLKLVDIKNEYVISSYSFRGNYSFLELEMQRSQYIRPKVTVHRGA